MRDTESKVNSGIRSDFYLLGAFNMSASAVNMWSLVTDLPLKCSSSPMGLLSEVTIRRSSLKLFAVCAHDLSLFAKRGRTCCIGITTLT